MLQCSVVSNMTMNGRLNPWRNCRRAFLNIRLFFMCQGLGSVSGQSSAGSRTEIIIQLRSHFRSILVQFQLSGWLLLGARAPSPAPRRRSETVFEGPKEIVSELIFALRAHCGRGRPRSQRKEASPLQIEPAPAGGWVSLVVARASCA